ncbi:uncharacterized protein UDID_11982 [Ustilago sp. UG-2017a]|nr:uncharacterized protein UDID_11982 [Ustilago sp. UG-2017a]
MEASKPQGNRHLANYNEFNNNNITVCTLLFERDSGAAATDSQPENDTYTADHVFGVSSSMHCDGPLDSAIHGFVDCQTIQRNVWCFCMPTLRKLVNGRGVPMDARSVVLGWQDLRMPDALRSRLLLWRDLAIHLLSRCCLAAITAGLQNNHWPQLSLEDFDREHAALVVYTITTAYDLCSDAQHPAFVGKWIKQGALLMEENRTLVFQPIQAAAPA